MNILVTGGAGFIGSHLCERLIRDGHTVTAVDNFITGSRRNVASLAGNPRFTLIEANIIDGLDHAGPLDAVMNLASPASPVGYLDNPIETMLVGSHGVRNALELARRNGARFLQASTSEVYGDPLEHPQKESYWGNVSCTGVRSVYDEAKRFAEALTMAYHRKHGLRTRIIRIFNTYGPRMDLNDGRVVPNFVKQAATNQPLTIYGDGSATRSFTYVSDLVEGMWRLLMSDEPMPVNVGNPREMTMTQFADAVILAAGSECRSKAVYVQPQNERIADDPQRRRPDITRARQILGWEPRVALEDGLRETLTYFRSVLN
ncbi:MAG: SDR family oxidoreductase [Thermoflexales bacterium]|nr:SDR family oxidoreductase [Thermoflexales bacterium]